MKAALRMLLVTLTICRVSASFGETVQIANLENATYQKIFGSYLVMVFKNNDVSLVRAGKVEKVFKKTEGLIGIDYADVIGGDEDDLILITSSKVFAIDLGGGNPNLEYIMKNETLTSRYRVQNTPKEMRLFYDLPGRKAIPLWFSDDGLYTSDSGNTVRIANEKLEVLYNSLGSQITMPGMDAISIGFPYLYVGDVYGDGHLEAAYIYKGLLKIVGIGDKSLRSENVSAYFTTFPGYVWNTTPFTFADVDKDGKKDLILFSIVFGSGQNVVSLQLVVQEFLFDAASKSGGFVSPPRQQYVLLDTRIGNAICGLEQLNKDSNWDLSVLSVDAVSVISDLILKRYISIQYTGFIFDATTGKFLAAETVPCNRSIDSNGGSESDAKGQSLQDAINRVDFQNILSGLISKLREKDGTPLLIVYNGTSRSFECYRAPEFKKVKTIKAPQFMRLTDLPMVAAADDSFDVYMIRRNVLYYERVSR